MAFLDDARDSLSEDELASLKKLNQKSADFEATPEEEKQLFALKTKVKEFVATRDRQKNLEMIAGKKYEIKDILQVSGYNKKEILVALNSLFPRDKSEETEAITTVGKFTFVDGKRYGLNKEYQEFKSAGMKKAIEGLTDFGKEWLNEEEKSTRGKVTQPNKVKFAGMFKQTVEALDKALGTDTKQAHKGMAKI